MSSGAQARAVTPLEPEPDLPAGFGGSPGGGGLLWPLQGQEHQWWRPCGKFLS